jgi:hypothetical protein
MMVSQLLSNIDYSIPTFLEICVSGKIELRISLQNDTTYKPV